MPIPVFAVTTRGLEAISAAEMQACGFAQTHTAYRRVEAMCDELAQGLLLRTVDDLFITLAHWDDILHTRAQLDRLIALGATLRLESTLAALAGLRSVAAPPHFSISANFVGQRNYSAPEIKQALARGLRATYADWQYTEDDHAADLNLRIFIEHTQAIVGIRVPRQPLHKRAYKIHHVPGSLKPTVAAALLIMAGARPEMRMIDPFCGAGTILTEAAAIGINAIGGDIAVESVRVARENCRAADSLAHIIQWDAAHLPLASASCDLAVTNLPWGRQISLKHDLHALYRTAFRAIERVIKPGGKVLLLTIHPGVIDVPADSRLEISLFGQTPTILQFQR